MSKMVCEKCGMNYYNWDAPRPPKDEKCHRCGSELSDISASKEYITNLIKNLDPQVLKDRVLNVLEYIESAEGEKSEYGKCLEAENGDFCDSWGHAENCPSIALGEISTILYGWNRFDKEQFDSYEIVYELEYPLLHPTLPNKVIHELQPVKGKNSLYVITDIESPERAKTVLTWSEFKAYKKTNKRWNLEYWIDASKWGNLFEVIISLPDSTYAVNKIPPRDSSKVYPYGHPVDWTFEDNKITRNMQYAFNEEHAKKITYQLLNREYPERVIKYNVKLPEVKI